MKVILTGSSGFIGQEVLSQCLSRSSITSIIALSRSELSTSHPKLRTIIHNDFSSYPPTLLSELRNADACIYSLGTVSPSKPDFNRQVNMDYTLAAAKAFAASIASASNRGEKIFRFVYCSGHFSEKDQDRPLWIMSENRKMRGEVELRLLQLGRENGRNGFEVFVARPGFALSSDAKLKLMIIGSVFKAIKVDQVAAAMIRVALEGASDQICESDTLTKLAEDN